MIRHLGGIQLPLTLCVYNEDTFMWSSCLRSHYAQQRLREEITHKQSMFLDVLVYERYLLTWVTSYWHRLLDLMIFQPFQPQVPFNQVPFNLSDFMILWFYMHVYMFVYTFTYMDKLSEYPNNIVWISSNILELKKTGRKNLKGCPCEYMFLYMCRNMEKKSIYEVKRKKKQNLCSSNLHEGLFLHLFSPYIWTHLIHNFFGRVSCFLQSTNHTRG